MDFVFEGISGEVNVDPLVGGIVGGGVGGMGPGGPVVLDEVGGGLNLEADAGGLEEG